MERTAEKLFELMRAYEDRFDDVFPTMCLMCSDEEICEMIQECLDKNEPYDIMEGLLPDALI